MSDEPEEEQDVPKKPSKLPLILGLVLGLAGAGGGFFAVSGGMLGDSGDHAEAGASHAAPGKDAEPAALMAYVPLDQIVVPVGPPGSPHFLRFTGQLEVAPDHLQEVEALKPRIVDVLNTYLRAVRSSDLQDNTKLLKLRAHMLRRIQIVSGEGRVNDLLIMEFLLT